MILSCVTFLLVDLISFLASKSACSETNWMFCCPKPTFYHLEIIKQRVWRFLKISWENNKLYLLLSCFNFPECAFSRRSWSGNPLCLPLGCCPVSLGHHQGKDHGQQDCSPQLLQSKLGFISPGPRLVLRTVTPRLQHRPVTALLGLSAALPSPGFSLVCPFAFTDAGLWGHEP